MLKHCDSIGLEDARGQKGNLGVVSPSGSQLFLSNNSSYVSRSTDYFRVTHSTGQPHRVSHMFSSEMFTSPPSTPSSHLGQILHTECFSHMPLMYSSFPSWGPVFKVSHLSLISHSHDAIITLTLLSVSHIYYHCSGLWNETHFAGRFWLLREESYFLFFINTTFPSMHVCGSTGALTSQG